MLIPMGRLHRGGHEPSWLSSGSAKSQSDVSIHAYTGIVRALQDGGNRMVRGDTGQAGRRMYDSALF